MSLNILRMLILSIINVKVSLSLLSHLIYSTDLHETWQCFLAYKEDIGHFVISWVPRKLVNKLEKIVIEKEQLY